MRYSRNGARPLVILTALVAVVGASACASTSIANAPVAITKSDAVVAGCSKVGDVSVAKNVSDSDVNEALTREARRQNANYVLIGGDGGRTGTAYRCTSPGVTAKS